MSMTANAPPAKHRWIAWYYLGGTPAFALIDLFLHLSVRVAIPSATGRAAYYAGTFGLGLLCRWRPRSAPFVGMGESAVNLFLLILAVMLPIYGSTDALLAGEPLPDPETMMQRVVNLALGGTILVWSFHHHRVDAGRILA